MIDIESNVAPKNVRAHSYQSDHQAWGNKNPVANSDELQRILALPRRPQELDGTARAEAIIDRVTAKYSRGSIKCMCSTIDPDRHSSDGCMNRLRLVQALALRDISICGGLLGPIGVGHGKTLIDLLAPLALADHDVRLSVLLIPASLASQLWNDYLYAGQHFHMPQIVIHGTPFDNTDRGCELVPLQPGAPICHVVKYSLLQRPEATAWLEGVLKPQAIISDEAHKLRNLNHGATVARVKRYKEQHPETKMVCVSGSMTKKTLLDYDHLADWCLRGGSPMPRDKEITADWCRAIDSSDNAAEMGALEALCAPGENVMTGFRRRLAETCGVVTTTAPAIDVALEIDEREPPFIPQAIKDALNGTDGMPGVRGYVRPDGEELRDALEMSRCAREVACGFYYKWIFPKHKFPDDIPLIEEWREARKLWNKEARLRQAGQEEHLDSYKLVRDAAMRAWGLLPKKKGLPEWKAKDFMRWFAVKDKVQYESEPVWIDEYLARDAANWALEQGHRIVWYEHATFGETVAKISGLPMFGGGKNGGGLLNDRGGIREDIDGSKSIILSIRAHGTGRNGLQYRFNEAGIPNPPASSDGWEQVLGRLHRIGQKSASVKYWFYKHTKELDDHVKQALSAALYVEGTLGAVQKLRIGIRGVTDWEPDGL